jgi:hypothetical protein
MPDDLARTTRRNLVLRLLGLLVGLGVLISVLIGNEKASQEDRFINARLRTSTNTSPNDPPVTVRGGSVLVHSYVSGQFAPYPSATSTATQMANLGTAASPILLTGVTTPKSNTTPPPSSVTLTPSTNWQLVISFRDKHNNENSSVTLTLCTLVNASNQCSLDNKATSQTIYLQSAVDGSGNPYGSFSPLVVDTNGLRFDVNDCDDGSSDKKESKCNHPFALYFYQGTDTTPSQTFRCLDGECTIGIGSYSNDSSLERKLDQ